MEMETADTPAALLISDELRPFPSVDKGRGSKQNESLVERTVSIDSDSFEQEERLVRIKDEEAVSSRNHRDPGNLDDSFMRRLSNISHMSSFSADSSHALQIITDSERFYVGTVEEEESLPSQVSALEEEDMSRGELLGLVQRIYSHLEQADKDLANEQILRKAREKNAIKLARELSQYKGKVNRLMAKNEELVEEVRMVQAEKLLMEQRLEHQVQAQKMERAETNETFRELKRDMEEMQTLYKHAGMEHEDLVSEMTKSHANQREQLYREVVQANQEASRLQEKLFESTRRVHELDRGIVGLRSTNGKRTKKRRARKAFARLFLFILMCGLCSVCDLNVESANFHLIKTFDLRAEKLSSIASYSLKGGSANATENKQTGPSSIHLDNKLPTKISERPSVLYEQEPRPAFVKLKSFPYWLERRARVVEKYAQKIALKSKEKSFPSWLESRVRAAGKYAQKVALKSQGQNKLFMANIVPVYLKKGEVNQKT